MRDIVRKFLRSLSFMGMDYQPINI